MASIQSIRNLGPKMEAHFRAAGIKSAEEIFELGLEESYTQIINAGMRPHFMAFLALAAGLDNLPFNAHSPDEKAALKALHNQILNKTSPEKNRFEALLDDIGIRG